MRSLLDVGAYRLVGVDSDHLTSGLYEPGWDARYCVPKGDEPGYVDAIADIVERENVDVVWPCSDEEVVSLASVHDRFSNIGAAVVTSQPDVVQFAVDKLAVARRLSRHGIAVPASCRLDEDFDDFRFPVIVRPITARSAKGVSFFDTAEQGAAYRDAIGDDASSYFVQECVPYRAGYLHMVQAIFDKDQQLKAFFTSRSIRTTYPWGGPALGGVPVKNDTLKKLTMKVWEETGPWFGPVNVEYLYDPDRREFVFIEVNPRYWGYSYLATAAGINFPDITVRLALGEQVEAKLDYSTDVFTLTSREQLAFSRDMLLGPLPGAEMDEFAT